jgi:hypothetical protein
MTLRDKKRIAGTCFIMLVITNICWWYLYLPDAGLFVLNGLAAVILVGTVVVVGFWLIFTIWEYATVLLRMVHREVIANRQRHGTF